MFGRLLLVAGATNSNCIEDFEDYKTLGAQDEMNLKYIFLLHIL